VANRRTTASDAPTRRERRAARRGNAGPGRGAAGKRPLRSPLLWLTVAAILIGAAGVIVVALQGPSLPGSAGGSASNSNGLERPSVTSPAALADGRAIGSAAAPATLTVWEDFQCPLCGDFTRQVEPKLYTDFVEPGTLRIVYRDFAFIGQESFDAASAARCAGQQGEFWPYHDYLFWNQGSENGGAFRRARLDTIADAIGLNRETFDACLSAGQTLAQVKNETAAGESSGIHETPTLVVGTTVMPGAPLSDQQYAALANVIRAAIAARSSASPS
jgi:protein-disulfide isomerase